MLTIRRYHAGTATTVDASQVREILDTHEGVLWIDLMAPTAEEEVAAVRELPATPRALEELRIPASRRGADEFDDCMLLTVQELAHDEGGGVTSRQIGVLLGEGWLVTRAEESPSALQTLCVRCETNPHITSSSAWLLYEVLEAVADEFAEQLEHFEDEIEAIEDAVEDIDAQPDIQRLYRQRRDVLRIRRAVEPQAEALGRMVTFLADGGVVPEHERHLFREMQIRFDRLVVNASYQLELLGSALESYRATVAQRQNEVMKVFAVLSGVLLPLTVVGGIYGMNFRYMPELDERWGYPFALGLMAVLAIGALWIFFAKGYIGMGYRRRRAASRRGGDLAESPRGGHTRA